MTANIHFLNVGWGDAHLIQLPSGLVTLIDGGDGSKADGQDHPLDWMIRNGVHQLDWMILTHIHEDHLNGLLDIANNKKIVNAVLPYEPFKLPSKEAVQAYGSDMSQRVFQMLNRYLELVLLLRKQGTNIQWRHDYAVEDRSVIWAAEGFVLSHLYPWEGDQLPAYDTLRQFAVNKDEFSMNGKDDLERFFYLSNHDSSVYRLSVEADPTESILFGGDQLETGWRRITKRNQIKSLVWKVSHHGMEDGFNARILFWIQPEYCVIPISTERATSMQANWEELRVTTDTHLYLTGDILKGENCTIYKGRYVNVQIG